MKLLFIQTGGTIDKDYPTRVKGYAFEFGEPAVKNILARVYPNFEYDVVTAFKKDSLDMNDEDRQKLYDMCSSSIFDKIIITHGTDTMTQTAAKLSVITGKTIVLTGAFQPEKFITSDADFNIGVAVAAATTLPTGVYIAMSGRVYNWDKCHKDQYTGQFVEL